MKNVIVDLSQRDWSTLKAIAEGLWNGVVVSGVMVVSIYLVRTFSFF